MPNTLKFILSLSLFLILVVGVTGYYYQIHSKSNTARLSNISEEDLHKEDFIKHVVFEDLRTECFFLPIDQTILFPHPPDCILEGHTGLVTPPPWS